jgi:hypothetical protein
MTGTVTSYTPSTQSLVCNMTSIGGGGTFTSWRIGYRGPRFDHTSAGVCRGLLIEEGRTNLVTQSGNASSWPNANGTVTNNGSTTAPDGSSNGFLGGIGTASLITPATSSVTGIHTASVFLKRNNTDWVRLQVAQGSSAHTVNFWVNLATGAAGTLAVGTGTPTSLSAQVTPFGNSWYRVSITASYPATASLTLNVISATADASVTRVAGSIYEVWGGQLEAGSFPTSYIPTTTGSVVRSADVCSITGGDFNSFYNQPEGTLFAGCTPQSVAQVAVVVGVNTTTFLNSHFIYKSDSTANAAGLRWVGASLATPVVTIPSTTDVATTFAKIAYAYKSGSFAMAYNNILAGTSSSTVISNPTAMRIGGRDDGLQLNGHLAAIRYYKKRLPNAKLQALTV